MRRDDQPREPFLDDEITAEQLDRAARKPLRSLSKENADRVARHLVAAGLLLDLDPELAYEHTQAAVRRAGRIDVVREAAALTAYATGRYAEALRELRTVRRLSGIDAHRAIEADCERGLGRPERALAVVAETDLATLTPEQAAELAIVASGARADLGEHDAALLALEAPHLDRVTDPLTLRRLAEVRADRLDELGRTDEAEHLRANLPDLPPEPEQDVVVYDTAVLPLPAEESGDGPEEDDTDAEPVDDTDAGRVDDADDERPDDGAAYDEERGADEDPGAPESHADDEDAGDNGAAEHEDHEDPDAPEARERPDAPQHDDEETHR